MPAERRAPPSWEGIRECTRISHPDVDRPTYHWYAAIADVR